MPDLKKLITLEALQAALPSWLKSSSKPSYTADEINDSSTANKFVTSTEKNTWNAKGTYSKPSGGIPKTDLSQFVQNSLDLADSALQSESDPTVPSWAKQTDKPSYTQDEVTDGTTYKRVTQTEKNAWSGKQNALTTTQMSAVNSGINSTKVGQISTNQTNIWYTLDKVGTNCASIDNATYATTSTDRYLKIPCGNTLTGNIHIHLDSIISSDTDATTCAYILYYTNGSSSNSAQVNRGVVIDKDVDIGNNILAYISIYPSNNYNNSANDTFTLTNFMVTSKAIWDQFPTFTPAALPNYDLTQLQAEDRAALAEEIDAGAKNLLNNSLATGTVSQNVTATVASNGSFTLSGTASTTTDATFPLISNTQFKAGTYVGTGCPKNGDIAKYRIDYVVNDSTVYRDYGDGVEFTLTSAANVRAQAVVYRNTTAPSGTWYPMICTKAAFGVSQKFVPYLKSNVLKEYSLNLHNQTYVKSAEGLYYMSQGIDLSSTFSEIYAVTIKTFNAVKNVALLPAFDGTTLKLCISDPTAPTTLTFSPTNALVKFNVYGKEA